MTLILHPARKAGRVLTLLSLTGLCAAALPAQAGITTLASFTGSGDIGSGPYGGVTLDGSGNLFGTTQFGGASGGGTVYEIKNGTSAITTLASFTGDGAGTNGGSPEAGVTFDSNGNLFGTTYAGGTSGFGTLYEIAKITGTLTTLASFTGPGAGTNGGNPFAVVTFDSSGNLFGTTAGGGASGAGTVYEIDNVTGTFTTLASFTGTNGSDPFAGVTFDSKGNLFGTTFLGGASGNGTVYEIAQGSSTLTTLASFTGANGSGPHGGVTFDSSGNLFGTTYQGGASGNGTVYEIDKGSSIINTLASFNATNGRSPAAGVTLDSGGNLFGTTNAGGAHDAGTVYEIAQGSSTITTLASFTGAGGNGSNPAGGVTLDGGGNLFGTTFQDGEFGNGTVYEIAQGSSIITTLVSFTGTNGGNPASAVTFDKSGNLFGTTYGGGASGAGTVYEIAGAGSPVPESSTVISLATLLGLGSFLLRARKRRQNATPGV